MRSEIKKLQKIAGILKEDDDFDLSDNPLSVRRFDIINHPSYIQIVEKLPFYLSMQGRRPYKGLYGLAEINGTCYLINIEKGQQSEDILAYKKGLSIDYILQDALSKSYFKKIDDKTYLGFDFGLEDYLLSFFE